MAGSSGKRTYLREVNPHLICQLCRGYLIDATTVVECLHSFCRSCILKHLRRNAQCPSCKQLLNTAKPNIKADKTLQDIVYKLVPGLYHKEMRRRREFYSKHPEQADSATPEQRGEDVSGRLIFAPEDAISLSLEYLPVGADPLVLLSSGNEAAEPVATGSAKPKANGLISRRYLQCPALVTIAHLKKFLALKYNVDITRFNVDICHRRAPLPEHWTLMDVAYIFAWKRNAPIRFFYRITQEEQSLEAPPNDRPSTPGLGASQPASEEQTEEQQACQTKLSEPEEEEAEATTKPAEQVATVSQSESKAPTPQAAPATKPVVLAKPKPTEIKPAEQAKRPAAKEISPKPPLREIAPKPAKESPNPSKPTTPSISLAEDVSVRQVKSPMKITKSPDGRYQVLQSPTTSPTPACKPSPLSTPAPAPPTPPAEFSVVSIGDGASSNGFKITLKQCSPGTPTSAPSKKPKVISNVLVRNADKPSPELSPEAQQRQEKQKRKVTFLDLDPKTPSPPVKIKKPAEQNDKKQFLHGFRLTAKQAVAVAAAAAATQSNVQPPQPKETTSTEQQPAAPEKKPAPEEKPRSDPKTPEVEKPQLADNQAKEAVVEKPSPAATKKRQPEPKVTSTNIADRLGEAKKASESSSAQPISSSSSEQQPQQPIDVYAFPSDPPAVVPPGAVKRKCPPGLPIFEMRKKQQQQQPAYQAGKKTGVNATKANAPVKCYRNQAKPSVYAKPPPSPARNLPSPVNSITSVPSNSVASPAVSSTSPKKTSPSPTLMISNDTRNLLDGCGLNIPASLSITLTSPKSPNRGSDPPERKQDSARGQAGLDPNKFNPSITLNDRSVDPRVLKALKSGQIRMPMPAPAKSTKAARPHTPEQSKAPSQPLSKRRKEDHMAPPPPPPPPPPQPRPVIDLVGSKKKEVQTLKIPIPPAKNVKVKPSWIKTKPREEANSCSANGQVVTLTDGQRYYRAPPGSLTPAAHRIGDMPMPARPPVYAPSCFSSPPLSRGPTSFPVFPSLQSLYALNQAPSLEQFHIDSRMRINAAAAVAASKSSSGSNPSTAPTAQVNKSHLAAQCAPVKPARSVGSFAVPIAKQLSTGIKLSSAVAANKPAKSSPADSETATTTTSTTTTSAADSGATTTTTTTTTEAVSKKTDSSKEAAPKTVCEQSESCASSSEARSSQQDAASPRVSSTASPSPPPSIGDSSAEAQEKPSSESDKRQPSSSSEATSMNKSPESPDSSSVVTESSPTIPEPPKPTLEKSCRIASPSSTKNPEGAESKEEQSSEAKPSDKVDTSDPEKPTTSEALQKRFLAAFPSNEWANAEFGHFLKSLPLLQAEAQTKNAKAAE